MNPLLRFIAASTYVSWYEDKSKEKYPDNATAPNLLVGHHFKVRFTNGSHNGINLDYAMNIIEKFYMNDGIEIHVSEVTNTPNSRLVKIISQGIAIPAFTVMLSGNALTVVTQN